MAARCDKQDQEKKEKTDKILEENKKKSLFSKLLKYNKPAILIASGLVASVVNGSLMPLTGVVLSELLTFMTAPFHMLALMAT